MLLIGALCKTFRAGRSRLFQGLHPGHHDRRHSDPRRMVLLHGSVDKAQRDRDRAAQIGHARADQVLRRLGDRSRRLPVHSSRRHSDRLLRGLVHPRHRLRRRYDERRSLRLAHADIWHEGGSRRFRADVDRVRTADEHDHPRRVRGGAFRAAGLCRRRAAVSGRFRPRQSRSEAQGILRPRRPS